MAGKTTVFNLINGYYAPDAGQILLGGLDLVPIAPRRRIRHGLARSFQNIRLIGHLTVLANVLLGAHVHAGGATRHAAAFGVVGSGPPAA